MSKSSVLVLVLVLILVGWFAQSCVPATILPTEGMPVQVMDAKALYDRNNVFLGVRYSDPDIGAVCYVFSGIVNNKIPYPFCVVR
jgi:hypothetical protein